MSTRLLVRINVLIFTLSIMLLQGCTTSAFKTADMRKFLQQSRFDLALNEAENALGENPAGVMENMNVGLLRRIGNDLQGSNEAFGLAKIQIGELYATSISEHAVSAVTNDELISFQGDRFEQLLVHLYMASNYLDMGDLDSARVEVLQSQVKMDEWGEPKDEMPFMRYFSGMIYEMLGEEDSAAVSYRKAVDAYKNTYDKHYVKVPLQLKHDLLRVLSNMKLWDEVEFYKNQLNLKNYEVKEQSNDGSLVVILGNGLVPQREQSVFQTWAPELAYNIRVAVPAYKRPPALVNKARIRIHNQAVEMGTVSNLDGLARAALEENIHTITARAIARAVVKKKTEKQVGERAGPLGELATMVVNFSSEIADTRCWNTLPQQFEFARLNLPEGDYSLAIELLNPAGYMVDVIYENVSIKRGQLSVISKHWTSPVVRTVATDRRLN